MALRLQPNEGLVMREGYSGALRRLANRRHRLSNSWLSLLGKEIAFCKQL
jgi:hypothetical protein